MYLYYSRRNCFNGVNLCYLRVGFSKIFKEYQVDRLKPWMKICVIFKTKTALAIVPKCNSYNSSQKKIMNSRIHAIDVTTRNGWFVCAPILCFIQRVFCGKQKHSAPVYFLRRWQVIERHQLTEWLFIICRDKRLRRQWLARIPSDWLTRMPIALIANIAFYAARTTIEMLL